MWSINTPGIKRFATSLPLILVVALGMRLAFAWDYQAHAPHQALGAIPFLFESGNIAYSLARGHGFGSPFRVDTGPTAWMTPLYPVLLAGIMRVFGIYTYQSWVAAVLMNIFFSALACIPVYYAGKRIGGIGLAAGAGWLWAIFPNAILLSFQSLWDQSLSALLGATIIWATLKLADKTSARDWSAYGLLWGLTLMVNASLLSLLPLLLGWAAYRNRKTGLPSLQKTLRNTALASGMVVLCCIPWTIRNYVVMHSLVPLRSILGLQLWVGNNPDAHVAWLGDHHPIHDSAERERYIRMGEIAYMSEKGKNAIRYILNHPRHEAGLIGGRFVTFWSGGSSNPAGDFIQNRSAWFRYVLVFNLCAAFGALSGIVILFRRGSIYAFPLAAGPVVFPFAYYLTLSMPRYRHAIDPTLMLLLAIALASHVDADILIVDEALAVGDISFRQRCMRKIHDLRSHGTTLLFVSRETSDVKALCGRCLWLQNGEVQELGEADGVVAEYLNATLHRKTLRRSAPPAKEPDAVQTVARQTAPALAANFATRFPGDFEGRRFGDGRATILDGLLTGPSGQPVRLLTPLERVVVRICFRANAPVDSATLNRIVAAKNSLGVALRPAGETMFPGSIGRD